MFNNIAQGRRLKKDDQLPGEIPFVMAGTTNTGVVNYISNPVASFPKNSITIDIFGNTFYRDYAFGAGDDTGVYWSDEENYSKEAMLFFSISMQKSLSGKFSYGNKLRSSQSLDFTMKLPINNGGIDFDFMESFIAELEAERLEELEAYLSVAGLKDTTLTPDEQQALNDFENGKFSWGEFSYQTIFNNIAQGRRLKKDDQLPGEIPFVMAGTTNTGVVNYISNPVASFPNNSITIDIFGNAFYRNYSFGAGDDTGVYWSDQKNYSKEAMLFFTTSMEKSLFGKFSYGKKLRSSQSLAFTMKLPAQNKKPALVSMETFISAIQKMVIKGVVEYADKKMAATKYVVQN
ncbi:restriction endonuclease subunit S (plasmid) [Methylomarinum sp. Ch1-1]|uniref:Restriction endonuclease subunit S n=1 Tax=Methylomarinum roseum TaxID=3067653 RepID=A0AAU7P0Z4_9GAMM